MPNTIFKRVVPITIFALLALLSWWLKDTTSPTRTTVDGKVRHDPDYYAENMTIYSMDKTGDLQYQLEVSHLEHYPDDQSMLLSYPQMILYQDQHPSWTITSDNGTVTANGKEVTLSNNVIAKLTEKENVTQMKLTTEDLLVRPDKKYAETDNNVLLQDENGSTRAKGMKADIEKNRIQLLSNVRGTYVSP